MSDRCRLGHVPESRGERRRLQRELATTLPRTGLGKGWALNVRGRRYAVREASRVPLAQLVAECDAVASRLGCSCPVEVAHG